VRRRRRRALHAAADAAAARPASPCANTSLVSGAGVIGVDPSATAADIRALRQFTIETRDARGQPTMVTTARFRIDFYVDDPQAGLINLRNPGNEPVPSLAARETFDRLFPLVEVAPDASRPGFYIVTYQTIVAGDFYIYVYLEGTSECSGLVTGKPFLIPGNCGKDCSVGGVCTVPSDTAPMNEWECLCFRPSYQPCNEVVPGTDMSWIERFPNLMGNLPFCCPAAPVIVSLRFADDPSTSLVAEFSTETNQAEMYGDAACDAVLADVAGKGLTPLGVGAYCAWQDRRTLLVWFGSNATVVVGDLIRLRESTIYSAAYPSGPAAADQAVKAIAAPLVEPVPRVLISTQETYNPCVPLEFDARLSTGGGGRTMEYEWSLLTPTGDNAVLGSLKTFLASQSGPQVIVPAALRAQIGSTLRGRVLQVSATARNHFGNFPVTPATAEVKVDFDVAAPQVRVVPPAAVVFRGQELKLTADIVDTTGPDCFDPLVPADRTLDYTWRQVRGPVFDMGVTTIKTLYIAPGALTAGETYEFEVEAAYASRPGLAAVAHVAISAVASPLVAIITGGDRRVPILGGRPLLLDASESFDPDESGRPLRYEWTILNAANSQPLLSSVDSATLLNAGTNGQASVSVPANKLSAGVFTASVRVTQPGDRTNRVAVASVQLTIVDAAGPTVRVTGPVGGLFAPQERLVLRGVVDADPREGPVTLQWRSVGGLFDLQQNRSRLATDPTAINLVVLPGTFGAGQSYTFRLEATTDGGTGFAEVRVTANARPNAGECTPYVGGDTPTSGIAVLTEFAVLCTNFEDVPTQTPLSYRAFRRPLGATDSSRDFPLTLSGSASPLVRFRLLDSTLVVVQISDSLGAVSEYVIGEQYTLTRSDRTPAQLLAQLELELYGPGGNGAPSTSDADRLANAADLIAQILKQAGVTGATKRQISMADATESRDKIVETLAGTLETEQTRETVTTRVRLLSATVQSGHINGKSRVTIVKFLTDVALPVIREGGFAAADVQAVVDLLGAVLTTAGGPQLALESFGQGVRDVLRALSLNEIEQMVAFEAQRYYVYRPQPVSDSEGVRPNPEIELKVEKRTAEAPLTSLSLEGISFRLPPELSQAAMPNGGVVGYEGLTVRAQIYFWAVGSRRVQSTYAVNGLTLFDAEGEEVQVDAEALGGALLEFDVALDPTRKDVLSEEIARNGTDGLCLFFDGTALSTRGCQSVTHSVEAVTCACSHLTDFAGGIGAEQLPPGPGPLDVQSPTGFAKTDYLWLILVLLLLLWFTLCVVFLLVLAHRRNKKNEGADTLAPYIDKAAGMGALALLGDGDVSDSSELERRDYALPVGVYQIPDQTEESDLRREDFSWALEGESETIAGIGSRGGAGRDEASDASEVGRADTYKESRLGKLAGPAGTTATKRVLMDTEIDLEAHGDGDVNVAKNTAGTHELQRPGATATTKTRRDE
jgi:hypothetical protein